LHRDQHVAGRFPPLPLGDLKPQSTFKLVRRRNSYGIVKLNRPPNSLVNLNIPPDQIE
jgi:hypothetical protein